MFGKRQPIREWIPIYDDDENKAIWIWRDVQPNSKYTHILETKTAKYIEM